MNLIFAFMLIITNTAQIYSYEDYKNSTEEVIANVLEAVQELTNEGDGVVILSQGVLTFSEESESDEEQLKDPKMKNILRVPIHYKNIKKERKRKQKQYIEIVQQEQKKVDGAAAQHKRRMDFVIDYMHNNYWTTLYLYGEVSRILRDREVKDDLRRMIETLESGGYQDVRKKVLECYRKAKSAIERERMFWDRSTNNMIVQVVKTTQNDGVHN